MHGHCKWLVCCCRWMNVPYEWMNDVVNWYVTAGAKGGQGETVSLGHCQVAAVQQESLDAGKVVCSSTGSNQSDWKRPDLTLDRKAAVSQWVSVQQNWNCIRKKSANGFWWLQKKLEKWLSFLKIRFAKGRRKIKEQRRRQIVPELHVSGFCMAAQRITITRTHTHCTKLPTICGQRFQIFLLLCTASLSFFAPFSFQLPTAISYSHSTLLLPSSVLLLLLLL